MNVTTGGQAVTEVDRIQDRISAATEDVFIHLAADLRIRWALLLKCFCIFCVSLLHLQTAFCRHELSGAFIPHIHVNFLTLSANAHGPYR